MEKQVETEVTEIEKEMEETPTPVVVESNYLADPAAFEHMQRVAKLFASAKNFVPDQYRGSIADCFLAVQYAKEAGINPTIFMQNSYPMRGRIAIEGKLAAAMLNRSSLTEGRIDFEYSGTGDKRSCTASIIDAATGKKKAVTVDVPMAKSAGWWGKSGSHWPWNTDQMLAYRSAMFLGRREFPEVLLGLQLIDEIPDMEKGKSAAAADLSSKLSSKK